MLIYKCAYQGTQYGYNPCPNIVNNKGYKNLFCVFPVITTGNIPVPCQYIQIACSEPEASSGSGTSSFFLDVERCYKYTTGYFYNGAVLTAYYQCEIRIISTPLPRIFSIAFRSDGVQFIAGNSGYNSGVIIIS